MKPDERSSAYRETPIKSWNFVDGLAGSWKVGEAIFSTVVYLLQNIEEVFVSNHL